ncbi:MAG: DUF5813 family protein [Haloarculaceae archaeon]
MTDELPDAVETAFERHEAFERAGDGYVVATTALEGRVTAVATPDLFAFTVTVRVPTIEAVTVDEVGEAVAEGWFDTLERRLEDAPKATRSDVELARFDIEREAQPDGNHDVQGSGGDGEDAYVTYVFEWDDPGRAADIAKTFVEYVEGTYVEGVVPGYDYESPVADLLDSASQGEGSGPPL